MPYRKEKFVDDEIYHITLRAIDNNLIFKDIRDYYRGIFSIYEFNNSNSVSMQRKRRDRNRFKEGRGRASNFIDEREQLVEILAFCFMPNHVHLLVRQVKDGGITKFMSKFGTGYAGYSNRRYNRKGHFFQDRFYSVHIENDDQLRIVFTYIHANPLSLFDPNWKKIKVENSEEYLKFLNDYKWSSYQDYIGIKNFPSVTSRNFMLELMGGERGCKDFTKYWIEYKGESEEYKNLFLE